MFYASNKIPRNVPPILTMQKKNLFAKLSLVEARNASATVRQSSSTTDLDFEQNRFPPRIPLFFFPPQVPLFLFPPQVQLFLFPPQVTHFLSKNDGKCLNDFFNCGFCSNRILLPMCVCVCQCVSHRRDISSFLDNLIVKTM